MRPVFFLFAIAAMPALGVLGSDSARARSGVLGLHLSPPSFRSSGLGRHLSSLGVCSVFSRHPCSPTVCSVFRHEPCLPNIQYFGETLQLTIVTDASAGKSGSTEVVSGSDNDQTSANSEHKVSTIRDMFDTLRACWIPPPEDKALPGMQMSVRFSFKRSGNIIDRPRITYTSPDAPPEARDVYHDAITAALDHCTPLPFTDDFGGAVAGHPIAIRFVDDRKVN
jgi:hypothetical protein